MEQFLNNTVDASVDPIIFDSDTDITDTSSAENMPNFGVDQAFGRQLLPLFNVLEDTEVYNQRHDGFYYCRLKKAPKKA